METQEFNSIGEKDLSAVAQLAVSNPSAVGVFAKYAIDYCCGGHRTLEEACRRLGLDAEKVRSSR